ncbi:MAG: YggS family pyridoxal phosphate-dependent enzyme [Desulfomonilaceae bacterium]
MISETLALIGNKIAIAAARAGRKPEEVRIVAAAKGQGREKIEEVLAAGIRIIGHNYLQEAYRELPGKLSSEVEFHMIGHLQKNKAAKAAEVFNVVQTVDDVKLAEALNRHAAAANRIMGVMIQLNLAGEEQKSGIGEKEVERLAGSIRDLASLKLLGMMTMPPFFDDPDRARPYFARLRELREKLTGSGILSPDMNELSMGMSGDFEVAVEEGATLVRIGTMLFGPRH